MEKRNARFGATGSEHRGAVAIDGIRCFGFGFRLVHGRVGGGLDQQTGPMANNCRGDRRTITNIQRRSEANTSELQSLMRISYADICLKNKIAAKIHCCRQPEPYKDHYMQYTD